MVSLYSFHIPTFIRLLRRLYQTHHFTTLQHTDISSWLEQAVLAYQGRAPANQIQLDALRVTVLYYEAWKMIGEWRGVAMALVRGAGEADEVPSAVMIEEACSGGCTQGSTGETTKSIPLGTRCKAI